MTFKKPDDSIDEARNVKPTDPVEPAFPEPPTPTPTPVPTPPPPPPPPPPSPTPSPSELTKPAVPPVKRRARKKNG